MNYYYKAGDIQSPKQKLKEEEMKELREGGIERERERVEKKATRSCESRLLQVCSLRLPCILTINSPFTNPSLTKAMKLLHKSNSFCSFFTVPKQPSENCP